MKTFEEFNWFRNKELKIDINKPFIPINLSTEHSDIDPYNEEEWDEVKPKPKPDGSESEIFDQVEMKKFVADIPTEVIGEQSRYIHSYYYVAVKKSLNKKQYLRIGYCYTDTWHPRFLKLGNPENGKKRFHFDETLFFLKRKDYLDGCLYNDKKYFENVTKEDRNMIKNKYDKMEYSDIDIRDKFNIIKNLSFLRLLKRTS